MYIKYLLYFFININISKTNTTDNSAALEPVKNIEARTMIDNICQYLFCNNKSKVKPGSKANLNKGAGGDIKLSAAHPALW